MIKLIVNVLSQVTKRSVMTLTFDPRSLNINKVTFGYEISISLQIKVNPTYGLGGVRAQTHTHTQTEVLSVL